MRVIPVIDLKSGTVVRAVGGKREVYQPVQSVISEDASPESVAAGLANRLGAREVYVADLDAIAGGEPAWDLYATIADAGLRLWVDAGIDGVDRAQKLARYRMAGEPLHGVIVGLESLAGPRALTEIADRVNVETLVFSLDLYLGRPLHGAADSHWGFAAQAAQSAIESGIRRIIVLDLARVGMGGGTGTESLCRQLHEAYPAVELISGGGLSSLRHIEKQSTVGCRGVLVGSALHDGRLTAEQLHESGLL